MQRMILPSGSAKQMPIGSLSVASLMENGDSSFFLRRYSLGSAMTKWIATRTITAANRSQGAPVRNAFLPSSGSPWVTENSSVSKMTKCTLQGRLRIGCLLRSIWYRNRPSSSTASANGSSGMTVCPKAEREEKALILLHLLPPGTRYAGSPRPPHSGHWAWRQKPRDPPYSRHSATGAAPLLLQGSSARSLIVQDRPPPPIRKKGICHHGGENSHAAGDQGFPLLFGYLLASFLRF